MNLITEGQKLTDHNVVEDSTLPKLRHRSEHLKVVQLSGYRLGSSIWNELLGTLPVTLGRKTLFNLDRILVTQQSSIFCVHSSGSPQQYNIRHILYHLFRAKRIAGNRFGNQMIRRVGQQIEFEFPHINQFSSLSPIPEFRKYFLTELKRLIKDDKPSSNKQISHLIKEEETKELKVRLKTGEEEPLSLLWSELYQLLRTPLWANDTLLVELLRLPLMRKCAHYLCNEKRRGYALNGVTHFHLRNGAVIWRLNWKGDPSPRGLDNSFGIMVNYRYYIAKLDSNSEKYIEQQSIQIDDNLKPFLSSTWLHKLRQKLGDGLKKRQSSSKTGIHIK